MFDLNKGYVPFATVLSLVAFVVWGTRIVTTAQLETEQRFVDTARIVKELAGATKDLAITFTAKHDRTWSKEDMATWCDKQQLKVPELTCPTHNYAPYSSINQADEARKATKKLEALESGKVPE